MSNNQTLFAAAKAKKFGVIHKLRSYFDEYDRCFAEFRERPIRMLEIGVSEGGSLAMWREYFPNAEVIAGIDIDPTCEQYTRDNVRVYIGNQTDKSFLERVSNEAGPFDIIIDDGGHTMRQNIVSFQTLFPLLKDGGVYVIEDLHTSYWPEFRDYPQTGISFLKDRIDDVTFWARRHPRASGFLWLKQKARGALRRVGINTNVLSRNIEPKNMFESHIRSIYFAESIAFIFKGRPHPANHILRF